MDLVECFDKVTLEDGTLSVPEGILEDTIIRIDRFFYPVDNVVVETSDFVACPLILGRDILATAVAKFDMDKGEVGIKYNDEILTYKVTGHLGGQFSDAEEECRLAQFLRRSQRGAPGATTREGEKVMLREPINFEDNSNRAAEWFGPFTIKIKPQGGMVSIEDDSSQRIMVHQSWLKIIEVGMEQQLKTEGE